MWFKLFENWAKIEYFMIFFMRINFLTIWPEFSEKFSKQIVSVKQNHKGAQYLLDLDNIESNKIRVPDPSLVFF